MLFILCGNSIVSQTTPFSNKSRSVEYYRINEMLKYAKYKTNADSIMLYDQTIINRSNSIIDSLRQKNRSFEREIIALNSQSQLKDERIDNLGTIMNLNQKQYESDLKIAKKKKWSWGAWGLLLGSIAGLVFGITL